MIATIATLIPTSRVLTSSTSITIAIEPSAAEKSTVRNFNITKLGAFDAKAVSPLKVPQTRTNNRGFYFPNEEPDIPTIELSNLRR